jgi:hypothetical protein
MAVSPRNHGPGAERFRALEILAGPPTGVHRGGVAGAGVHGQSACLELAVARPDVVKAGGRTLSMLRLTITDTGQRALAGM